MAGDAKPHAVEGPGEAAAAKPTKIMLGTCGRLKLTLMDEKAEMSKTAERGLRGTPASSRRASQVYLILGSLLSAISLWGFTPAIYWRLTTGQWWRDPINIRLLPLPASIDLAVSAHGIAGMAWLVLITLQLVSGTACSMVPAGVGEQLRVFHRWIGNWSSPFAYAFFATCGVTLIGGLVSEPIGKGWNTLFIRAVQLCAVGLAFLLYLLGLYQALCRNYALHKDCMMGSILFALVPTGVPRFGRDLLQWAMGEQCNVSTSPELWFFLCCIYCIFGWPLLFVLTKRYYEHAAFPFLLRVNIGLIVGFLIMFRPSLHLDDCFWEALRGTSGEAAVPSA